MTEVRSISGDYNEVVDDGGRCDPGVALRSRVWHMHGSRSGGDLWRNIENAVAKGAQVHLPEAPSQYLGLNGIAPFELANTHLGFEQVNHRDMQLGDILLT
jgi:hypothetical protein